MPIPGNNLRDNIFMTPIKMRWTKKNNKHIIAKDGVYYALTELERRDLRVMLDDIDSGDNIYFRKDLR